MISRRSDAIGFGALAAADIPLPAFVVLAGCCALAALVTAFARVDAPPK